MSKQLYDIDKRIDSHEACENDFFRYCRESAWSPQQVRAFGPEYYHWVKAFPGILSGLVCNCRDEDSRFFLTEILFSELGSGKPDNMHFKLFARVLRAAGLSDKEIEVGPCFAETERLVTGMRDLYSHADILIAFGAQYALEKQAFPMIDKLYRGFQHYEGLSVQDMEYFELHLVEEPEHLACMKNCIARYVESENDHLRIVQGVNECLDLIATFWCRLFTAITELE